MRFSAKRISTLAVLTALSLIMFVLESLFPPLFVPGAKMGLSNIFTMLAIILLSPLDAVILVAVRTVLGSLIVGNMATLIYSFSAGMVAVLVGSLLYVLFFDKISIVSIGVVSAVFHNLTQNIVFCLVTETPELFVYLPYLTLLGVLAGLVVGVVVSLILKKLPLKNNYY